MDMAGVCAKPLDALSFGNVVIGLYLVPRPDLQLSDYSINIFKKTKAWD